MGIVDFDGNKTEKKQFYLQIPLDLYEGIETAKRRLKANSAKFDFAQRLVARLMLDLSKVNEELDKHEEEVAKQSAVATDNVDEHDHVVGEDEAKQAGESVEEDSADKSEVLSGSEEDLAEESEVPSDSEEENGSTSDETSQEQEMQSTDDRNEIPSTEEEDDASVSEEANS